MRDDPPAAGGPIGLRATLIAAAWFFAVFAVWAISSPLMGIPDEPAHTVKAASVWQGDLRGEETMIESSVGMIPADLVEVPESFASSHEVPGCYAFNADQPASCAPDLVDSARLTEVVTTAGPYPPLYYAAVGWPSRLWANDGGVYLMRLASAALGAALCALALRSLTRSAPPALAVAGMTVALTPMVPFLVASVNPAGLEIAAAILWWASTLGLVMSWRGDRPLDRSLLAEALIGFAVLVNTRGLGAVFAGLALLTVAGFSGWRQTVVVLRDRRAWILGGAFAVLTVVAGLWVVANGQLDAVPGAPLSDGVDPIIVLLGATDDWLLQMVAVFGWLDTGPLAAVVMPWGIAAAMLLAASIMTANRRQTVVVSVAVAATALLPVLFQLQTVERDGIAWQGRYLLPYAVGVPLMMVVGMAGRGSEPTRPENRTDYRSLLMWATALCAVAMTYAQYSWLRRAAIGNLSRALNPFTWTGWTPPVSVGLLVVATAVLAAVPIAVVGGWLPLRGAKASVVDADNNTVESIDGA